MGNLVSRRVSFDENKRFGWLGHDCLAVLWCKYHAAASRSRPKSLSDSSCAHEQRCRSQKRRDFDRFRFLCRLYALVVQGVGRRFGMMRIRLLGSSVCSLLICARLRVWARRKYCHDIVSGKTQQVAPIRSHVTFDLLSALWDEMTEHTRSTDGVPKGCSNFAAIPRWVLFGRDSSRSTCWIALIGRLEGLGVRKESFGRVVVVDGESVCWRNEGGVFVAT